MKRLNSIELSKGIAIICILLTNTINYWLSYSYESSYLFSVLITLLEIFGSSLLIFLLSFSVIFTLKKKMGCFPDRENRIKLFKQSFILILLGIAYNLIFNYVEHNSLIVWGWNILMFIGIGQFICYYTFKLARWSKIVVGLIIILITPYIREFLFLWKESNIVTYIMNIILVSSTPTFPLLPFASLWFFSAIFSELIYDALILESDKATSTSILSIMKYALIFIIVSFAYSTTQFLPFVEPFSYNPNKYPFIDSIPILRGTSITYIPGIPEVLIKGTIQNIFFIIGISLFIIGLSFYFIEIKKKESRISKILIIFGRSTITLLFFQWLFLPLFNQLLIYYIFIPILLAYIIIIGLIVYLWERKIDLKYNIEWLIRKISKKSADEII